MMATPGAGGKDRYHPRNVRLELGTGIVTPRYRLQKCTFSDLFRTIFVLCALDDMGACNNPAFTTWLLWLAPHDAECK